MGVLLLRLMGPMQSWGTQSRFSHRDSDLEPSKSGIMGLLCAAMGIPREDTTGLARLAELKMGIRVDRQGTLKSDYHTAMDVIKANGSRLKKGEAVISHRFYLADACFLAALQGEKALLQEVHHALAEPVWQLFLGRKAFPPGLPVYLPDGWLPDCYSLERGLKEYPLLVRDDEPQREVRTVIEAEYGTGDSVRQDQPLSFLTSHRRFTVRHVINGIIRAADLPTAKEDSCICLV